MIKEWIEEYKPATQEAAEQALREIMQEIALAGLARAGFFRVAAFYGGTALRLFYKLPRFSEDLDFSLIAKDDNFRLEPYLDGIREEFKALGITVTVEEKNKTAITKVNSAFLKSDTTWKELIIKEILPEAAVKMRASIKIKIEVDTHPPLQFDTEEKLLVKPFSFYVKTFTLPNLFAGKMHALLFRNWKNRVKGRDWFDMEWYLKQEVPLNAEHFLRRAQDSGDWQDTGISKLQIMDLLTKKINTLNFDQVRADITPFVPDPAGLAIWSRTYFLQLIRKFKFVDNNFAFAGETWSDPITIHYGRDIQIRASEKGVTVSVFNATGMSLSKLIAGVENEISILAPEIAHINPKMIRFKSTSGNAFVEFTQGTAPDG